MTSSARFVSWNVRPATRDKLREWARLYAKQDGLQYLTADTTAHVLMSLADEALLARAAAAEERYSLAVQAAREAFAIVMEENPVSAAKLARDEFLETRETGRKPPATG